MPSSSSSHTMKAFRCMQRIVTFSRLTSYLALSMSIFATETFIPTNTAAQIEPTTVKQTHSEITTVAGIGNYSGYDGDGGLATLAHLNEPHGVAGNSDYLFIADTGNHCIRQVTFATGIISTLAGVCESAGNDGDGGAATLAHLNQPVAVSPSSTDLYIADKQNHCIRKVTFITGVIINVAGTCGSSGMDGEGGPATAAQLWLPVDVVWTVDGLYILEYCGLRLREVNHITGIIVTVAGTGVEGYSGDGGLAVSANLRFPINFAIDVDFIYISDQYNSMVRKVTRCTGIITAFAGVAINDHFSGDGGPATSAAVCYPTGLVATPKAVYISDNSNHCIRKVSLDTGIITTIAGTPKSRGFSGDGGDPLQAQLKWPGAIFLQQNRLYIADTFNHCIRVVIQGLSKSATPTLTSEAVPTATPPQHTTTQWQSVTVTAHTIAKSDSVTVSCSPLLLTSSPSAVQLHVTVTAAGSYTGFPVEGVLRTGLLSSTGMLLLTTIPTILSFPCLATWSSHVERHREVDKQGRVMLVVLEVLSHGGLVSDWMMVVQFKELKSHPQYYIVCLFSSSLYLLLAVVRIALSFHAYPHDSEMRLIQVPIVRIYFICWSERRKVYHMKKLDAVWGMLALLVCGLPEFVVLYHYQITFPHLQTYQSVVSLLVSVLTSSVRIASAFGTLTHIRVKVGGRYLIGTAPVSGGQKKKRPEITAPGSVVPTAAPGSVAPAPGHWITSGHVQGPWIGGVPRGPSGFVMGGGVQAQYQWSSQPGEVQIPGQVNFDDTATHTYATHTVRIV